MRKKLEDTTSFEKDAFSKAVVNVDSKGLYLYKKQREKMINMKTMEEEVANLKDDVTDIKQMLSVILKKLEN